MKKVGLTTVFALSLIINPLVGASAYANTQQPTKLEVKASKPSCQKIRNSRNKVVCSKLPSQLRQPIVLDKNNLQTPMVRTEPQRPVVPQTSAITVIFNKNSEFDVGQKQSYSETHLLAHALFDARGNVVAPANTPVTLRITPKDKAAYIEVESLVINGRTVPVKAESWSIPGFKHTLTNSTDRVFQERATWNNVGALGGYLATGGHDENAIYMGAAIAGLAATFIGKTSPENLRLVQIPQGNIHTFSLLEPLQINQ
jgi:hypothetical protein